MHLSSAKTPRNLSNNINSQVQSKYMQFQTFVPSSNISANVVRGRSANLRLSMYNSNRGKGGAADGDELIEGGGHKYTEPNEGGDDSPTTPTTKEFREFKRKERIIEAHLGNLKNSNLRSSRVQQDNASSSSRVSNNLFKSTFKSSFIDLAQDSHSNNSNGSNGGSHNNNPSTQNEG